jgi:four helix bundle protein
MKYQRDIRERTFEFSVSVIRLCKELDKNEVNKVLVNQLLRSSTSVGANLEEAQGAHTRPDFINCTNIAKKEARETVYWLKLISEFNLRIRKQIDALVMEAQEIAKILTTSVKNLKLSPLSLKLVNGRR